MGWWDLRKWKHFFIANTIREKRQLTELKKITSYIFIIYKELKNVLNTEQANNPT